MHGEYVLLADIAIAARTLPTSLTSRTRRSGSCSVTYTPSAVGSGSHKITATYNGDDGVHAGSSNTSTVSVAAAPSVSLTAPSNGSATNDASPTFAGVGDTRKGDDQSVTVKIW